MREAEALESRARNRPKHEGAPSLTLTQVYSICREHQLLCTPLNNLQSLRRWLAELREFKPSAASKRAAQKGLIEKPAPDGGVPAEKMRYPWQLEPGLPPPDNTGEVYGNGARIDEFVFTRLVKDLDPIERLRDDAHALGTTVAYLVKQCATPRHAARFAAESRAARWEALGEIALRSLDTLHAHLGAHAIGYVRRQLLEMLAPPPPPYAPRAKPAFELSPPHVPPPRPPPYEIDRSMPIESASEPPRLVYAAHERSGGGAIGCVAVVSQAALGSSRGGDHLAIEVAASRALADACELFTRALGYELTPPSVRQRQHEAHLAYEPTPNMTPLDQLLALNGPLGGKLGAERKKGQPSSADGGVGEDEGGGEALLLRHILSLWGRQLLLALQAAHKRGILLRTLRLSHILVSSDGRRIKLGPSALANFALTDGSTPDGGGRVLSANELPPLRGPISSAMAAAPRADLAAARASTGIDEVLFAKPLVRSMPDALPSAAFTRASASGWGAQALEGMVGAPLEEALLPPELLARIIVPSEGVAGPDGNPRGAWRDSKGSEFLNASIDLWNVGRFLFEAYYGEPPADYATCVLEHCTSLGLDPRAAVPTILAAALEPLPAHHRATTLPAAAPSSRPRTAVEELEAREAAAAELSEVGAAAAEATAAAAASLPPAEGERSRSLVPVPPFTYDPFATLKAKARRSAERARDDAPTSGRPKGVVVGAEEEDGGAVGGARGAALPRARAFVEASQLPSVSFRRAAVHSDPNAIPVDLWPGELPGEPPGTRAEDGAPAIADVIASCLQAHPQARPSLDGLLACKLFAIDQGSLLAAKHVAQQYMKLPRPERYIERELTNPMRELHRLRLAAGRMPTHGFDSLLQRAIDTCIDPYTCMIRASVAPLPRSGGPTVSFAAGPPPGSSSGASLSGGVGSIVRPARPTTAAEAEACRTLVRLAIVTHDVWGSLRLMVLHDLAELTADGTPPLPRSDPRVGPLLKFGRALRTLISSADLNDSFVRPYVAPLMSQLVMLACGDARLTSPRACLAPDWLASHMPPKPSAPSAALAAAAAAAAAAGTLPPPTALPASVVVRLSASPAGASLLDGGMSGELLDISGISRTSRTISDESADCAPSSAGAAALYASLVHDVSTPRAAWRAYAPDGSHRWTPSLHAALQPVLEAMLGEDGTGSFSLPSLRQALQAANAAAAAEAADAAGATALGKTTHRAGAGASSVVARTLLAPPTLTRGDCAELLAALASLCGLHPSAPPSDSAASGSKAASDAAAAAAAARRAKCTALTHLGGMLRRKPGIRMCAQLEIPQHAFPALSDADAGVRAAALELFVRIAKLFQLGPSLDGGAPSATSLDGGGSAPATALEAASAEATAMLYGCFSQHAMMAALSRPLHDAAEVLAVREKCVELFGLLALSDQPEVHVAIQRANVWGGLMHLIMPTRVPDAHQLVDFGVRAIFERVVSEGVPPVLEYLHARPPLRQKLLDLGLELPPPPTLAGVGTRARATLVAEGDDHGLPPEPISFALPPRPPPVALGDVAPPKSTVSNLSAVAALVQPGGTSAHEASRRREAAIRRDLEFEVMSEMELDGPLDASAERVLLLHAGSCLRLPWCHHRGDAASQRAYLHATLALGVRRAERSLRTLQAAAERDQMRRALGELPGAAPRPKPGKRDSDLAPASAPVPWVPAAMLSNPLERTGYACPHPLYDAPRGGAVTTPGTTPRDLSSSAAPAAASTPRSVVSASGLSANSGTWEKAGAEEARAAAEARASEQAAEAAVQACFRLFHAAGLVRAPADVAPLELLVRTGAAAWIARAALAAGAIPPRQLASGVPSLDFGSGDSALVSPPPVLSEVAQMPLLRLQRSALELLCSLLLPQLPTAPPLAGLAAKLQLGRMAIEYLQRGQLELSACLGLEVRVPKLFLQEYAAGREARLSLWQALLADPSVLGQQIEASDAVDRLILLGALPDTRTFELPLIKLPGTFVPFHKGMALRSEGLRMLAAMLTYRHTKPRLFEQLVSALQRDCTVARELARLSSVVAGTPPRNVREEALYASVVTLALLLDSAREDRLWQLLLEADAPRILSEIHRQFPELPPVPLAKLLEGEHLVQRPLGRAAATFVAGVTEYERVHGVSHPLMSAGMRL